MYLDLPTDTPVLPEATGLALFRIAQEALWNVAQHAAAPVAEVRLLWGPESVTLEIRDNGLGFAPPSQWSILTEQGHLGLAGAAERAEALGGHLAVVSAPGQGVTVRAIVPRFVG